MIEVGMWDREREKQRGKKDQEEKSALLAQDQPLPTAPLQVSAGSRAGTQRPQEGAPGEGPGERWGQECRHEGSKRGLACPCLRQGAGRALRPCQLQLGALQGGRQRAVGSRSSAALTAEAAARAQPAGDTRPARGHPQGDPALGPAQAAAGSRPWGRARPGNGSARGQGSRSRAAGPPVPATLRTMEPMVFLFMLLKSLIQYPQHVADALDEETRLRMEERAKHLEWERIHLEQEVEQLTQEQLNLSREEDEQDNRGADEEEARNVAANEDNVGNEDVNEAAVAENNNDVANDVQEEEEDDFDDFLGEVVMERIQWPVQDLQRGCEWITDLMDNYTMYFGHVLANSFYPVLQRAIGVGSAFEGWSPREQDVVYSVLIPMTPPRGHSFHLELESEEQRHVRNFRVRVQLECTCSREQQAEDMLCFLHHPEEELSSNQDPSLLDTLCTGSYLDVQKTARWFYQLVRAVWPALPQSHNWHLRLMPSTRSCQFKVSYGQESFRIELFFGVRRGDSAIFVCSQPREAYTASTTWPESYAVAEVEFFKHIARQAPPDSLHLKCLQFFTRLPLGFSFSTYTMKTIVMHLLNITPVSEWRRRDLVVRLLDIINSLHLCLRAKCLHHFIVGNQRLPQDINLPADVQRAEPYNLLQHLAQQPAAHAHALYEYHILYKWFRRILLAEDLPDEGEELWL
ncbi:inositol 1,4,5-trisphosphate receptor-interacting protein-like 1 [Passer domesticus]|uniref:inositol 1,4,5-trisphosphate receptor-interacting protein-like 1 n=1 Tax=Passer domesticus TaxID=48849 RepID=UPI0030FE6EB7